MKHKISLRFFCYALFVVSFLHSSAAVAQIIRECEPIVTFTAPPEMPPTLCQRFYNEPILPQTITLGIPGWMNDTDVYLQTGNWGISNKVVHIQGNFTVYYLFEIKNCWVPINQNVEITVGTDNGPEPTLILDNSKLFCCNGLWKGIKMRSETRVNTLNNSEIEDAITAIKADAPINTLSVENTTFNRNRVGIQIGRTITPDPPGSTHIMLLNFTGNKFKCTSALNGTSNEITFAGVLIQRVGGAMTFGAMGGAENLFQKIQYGIYDGPYLINVGLNYPTINVFNCKFDAIIRKGIYVEPVSVLTVFGSNFINNGTHCIDVPSADRLTVKFSHFTYTDAVIENSMQLYYGVRFNPNGWDLVFNETDVSQNIFDVNFLNQTKLEAMHCISMYGASDGYQNEHYFDQNDFHLSFQQSTDMPQQTRAISIAGGIHPNTESTIYDNHLTYTNVGSQSATCTAIYVADGDYNNLIIGENNFHHLGVHPGLRGEEGIRIYGSEGGDGNAVIGNIFDDLNTPVSQAFNAGIVIADYPNVYCAYNYVRESSQGFWIHGQNPNTQMICNTIQGGNTLLRLDFGIIGPQGEVDGNGNIVSTNGNQWFNVETANFDADCSPTFLAQSSRFYVNGMQSATNPNFPDQINPVSDWFKGDGPEPMCAFQAAAQYPLEKSIASGEYENIIKNPTDNWEAERYLLNRLNSDAVLLNAWDGFEQFKLSKENSTMVQLSAVQKMIKDAFVPSPSLASQAQQKESELASVYEQAVQLDAQIYTTGGSETLIAQRKQLQTSIAGKQAEAITINASHQSAIISALQAAKTANSSIPISEIYETNTKSMNAILIDLALNGTLTEAQISLVKDIAGQCPRDGGMAVYKARGILPDCDKSLGVHGMFCYPSQERNALQSSWEKREFLLSPNPNLGSFTLAFKQPSSALVLVYDALGILLIEKQVVGGEVVEANLKPGTYFCRVQTADGEQKVIPFVVTR